MLEGDGIELNTKFKDKVKFGYDWTTIMTSQYPMPVMVDNQQVVGMTAESHPDL